MSACNNDCLRPYVAEIGFSGRGPGTYNVYLGGGFHGERMTLADLPSPTTRRWMPKHKARVVAAVEGGLISREEACERYALSDEEYASWKTPDTERAARPPHQKKQKPGGPQ